MVATLVLLCWLVQCGTTFLSSCAGGARVHATGDCRARRLTAAGCCPFALSPRASVRSGLRRLGKAVRHSGGVAGTDARPGHLPWTPAISILCLVKLEQGAYLAACHHEAAAGAAAGLHGAQRTGGGALCALVPATPAHCCLARWPHARPGGVLGRLHQLAARLPRGSPAPSAAQYPPLRAAPPQFGKKWKKPDFCGDFDCPRYKARGCWKGRHGLQPHLPDICLVKTALRASNPPFLSLCACVAGEEDRQLRDQNLRGVQVRLLAVFLAAARAGLLRAQRRPSATPLPMHTAQGSATPPLTAAAQVGDYLGQRVPLLHCVCTGFAGEGARGVDGAQGRGGEGQRRLLPSIKVLPTSRLPERTSLSSYRLKQRLQKYFKGANDREVRGEVLPCLNVSLLAAVAIAGTGGCTQVASQTSVIA